MPTLKEDFDRLWLRVEATEACRSNEVEHHRLTKIEMMYLEDVLEQVFKKGGFEVQVVVRAAIEHHQAWKRNNV